MRRKALFLAMTAVLGLLTACAGRQMDQQLVAEPDPVALRLAAAADKASAALTTLASIEQARNPAQAVSAAPDAPQELRRTLSINWVGPIEPVARVLADRAGYQLQINGEKPSVPVVISLNAREKSLVDILRDIGLQAGKRADIAVDPDRRMVELNYAPVSGG